MKSFFRIRGFWLNDNLKSFLCIGLASFFVLIYSPLLLADIKWTTVGIGKTGKSAGEACSKVTEELTGSEWSARIGGVQVLSCAPNATYPNYQGYCTVIREHPDYQDITVTYGIIASGTCDAGSQFNSQSCTCEPADDDCDKQGNPVTPGSGRKVQYEMDYASISAFPLQVARTYLTGSEGGKWYFSDLKKVAASETVGSSTIRSIVFQRGDGSDLHFIGDNANGFVPTSPENSYQVERIPEADDKESWILTSPAGDTEIYDTQGYIQSHETVSGLRHVYTYAWTNTAVQITVQDSATGHALLYQVDMTGSITTKMDAVTSVTLPGGATLQYTYMDTWPGTAIAGNQLLETVTYPAVAGVSAIKTYRYADNNGDGTVSSTERTSYGQFLTGILEDGLSYASWRYDASKRAVWSEHGSPNSGIERTQLSYGLDAAGRIDTVTVTNATGLQTVRHYDLVNGKNRITAIDGAANSGCLASNTAYTYDTNGYRDTATDSRGYVTETQRDGQGRILVRITGQTWVSGFDSSLQPGADSQKQVITYWQDTALPATRTFYGYNTNSNAWVAYRAETFTYDANNNILTRTLADNTPEATPSRTWSYTNSYHGSTAVLAQVVVNGPRPVSDTVTYIYNTSGQLTSVTDANSRVTTYADYNNFGLPETVTDVANNIVTTLDYDTRGRLKNTTTAGASTGITYWPNGLVKRVTQPDASYLEYTYNSAHQLVSVVNQKGEHIEYTPSVLNGEWSDAITYKTPGISDIATQQHRLFDALGRLWKQKNAAGVDKVVYGHDQNDNLTNIIELGDASNAPAYDNNSRVVYRAYDGQNRLTTETRCADAGTTPPLICNGSPLVTTYTYDAQGNVATVTDAEGHITSYIYNGFGELVQQTSPDTGITKYEYDEAGNLSEKTKAYGTADAQVITYSWDALNRLTGIDYPGPAQDVTYTWDESGHGSGIGRLTTVTDESGSTGYSYNAHGFVTSKQFTPAGTGSPTLTTQYAYTANGTQLDVVTLPGGQQIKYPRTNGDISSITTNGTTTINSSYNLLTALTHQPFGGVSGWQTNSGGSYLHSRSYDQNGRLLQRAVVDGNAASIAAAYEYDSFSHISAQRRVDHPDQDEVYEYDALARLTKVTAQYGRTTYGYDDVGNRISRVLERQDPATQAWNEFYTEAYGINSTSNRLESVTRTRGATNLRSRSFAYDARGNITTDTRSKTVSGTTTTDTLELDYGNSDRLNAVDVQ